VQAAFDTMLAQKLPLSWLRTVTPSGSPTSQLRQRNTATPSSEPQQTKGRPCAAGSALNVHHIGSERRGPG
jgi:hypothetical protein